MPPESRHETNKIRRWSADRIPLMAAAGAVVLWGLKALAIWTAGGLDQSPLEGPLFILGALSLAVAFVAIGVVVVGAESAVMRVVGGVAGLIVGVVIFALIEEPVGGMVPESAGWVREEAGLWVVAIVTLLIAGAVATWRSSQPTGQ